MRQIIRYKFREYRILIFASFAFLLTFVLQSKAQTYIIEDNPTFDSLKITSENIAPDLCRVQFVWFISNEHNMRGFFMPSFQINGDTINLFVESMELVTPPTKNRIDTIVIDSLNYGYYVINLINRNTIVYGGPEPSITSDRDIYSVVIEISKIANLKKNEKMEIENLLTQPNPFNNEIIFCFPQKTPHFKYHFSNLQLMLYDMAGNEMKFEFANNGESITVNCENLTASMYIFKLINDYSTEYMGKLIKY